LSGQSSDRLLGKSILGWYTRWLTAIIADRKQDKRGAQPGLDATTAAVRDRSGKAVWWVNALVR